jgi:hypothetical protein
VTALEVLVCFVQQSEKAGVVFEGVDPLEASGPGPAFRDFVEVVRWLREEAASRDQPEQADHFLRLLKGRGASWCRSGGGIDWQRFFHQPDYKKPLKPRWPELYSGDWAFSRHEQQLLARGLGCQVDTGDTVFKSGRLEGVMPGRCFVTPEPYSEPKGNAVCRFLQRTERALPYSSHIVDLPTAS